MPSVAYFRYTCHLLNAFIAWLVFSLCAAAISLYQKASNFIKSIMVIVCGTVMAKWLQFHLKWEHNCYLELQGTVCEGCHGVKQFLRQTVLSSWSYMWTGEGSSSQASRNLEVNRHFVVNASPAWLYQLIQTTCDWNKLFMLDIFMPCSNMTVLTD